MATPFVVVAALVIVILPSRETRAADTPPAQNAQPAESPGDRADAPAENKPGDSKPTETANTPPQDTAGTPAAVLDDKEVDSILGKGVRSNTGDNMGRIVDVLVSRSGRVRGAVIDFGGFLGVGSRKIAIDWSALRFNLAEKQIAVDLTKDQLRVAPEYKSGEPVVILGAVNSTGTPGSPTPAQDK